jgi:protein O-mannosyl-transferase
MAERLNRTYKKNNSKNSKNDIKPGFYNKKDDYLLYLPLLGIIIYTAILYFKSINNGFVNWDDSQYFFENNLITDFSWNGVKDAFKTSSSILGTYQPLTTLSWMIDCRLWGFHPEVFHRTNLVLHLFNTALIFIFIYRLSGNRAIANLTAFFFAVHPMHVESVAWNSERKDVLYAFFFLLSLITYLIYLKQNNKLKYIILSFVLFGLSLFSKSMAITLPFVLFIIDYFKGRKVFSKKCIMEKMPFILLSVVFSFINIQSQQKGLSDLSVTFSYFDRIFLITYSLSFYIIQFFLPLNLSILHYYPELNKGLLPVEYYLSFFFILIVIWIIYKFGKRRKFIIFGSLFFFITILPVIQLVPVGMAMMSERYTYIPYTGLLLIIFMVFSEPGMLNKLIRPVSFILIAGFSVYFSVLTWNRIKVWENDFTLWNEFVSENPDYFYGYYGLGGVYDKQKNYTEEIDCFSRCISLNPLFYRAWADRGMAKDYNNDMEGAIKDYLKTIELDPNNDGAYNNLAVDNYKMKKYDVALSYYNKSLAVNPGNAISWMNRGLLHLTLNDTVKACEDFYHARELRYSAVETFIKNFCK